MHVVHCLLSESSKFTALLEVGITAWQSCQQEAVNAEYQSLSVRVMIILSVDLDEDSKLVIYEGQPRLQPVPILQRMKVGVNV